MLKIITILFIVIILVCLMPVIGYAGWNEPSDVISEGWGTADNQVGYTPEDTADSIPEGFWILGSKIVLRDQENRRIKIYTVNGVREKVINWIKQPNGSFKIPEYPLAGSLVGYIADNLVTYYSPQDYYVFYSTTGDLLKTMKERPLELGRVTEQRIGTNKYKITVTYPDKVYSMEMAGPYEKYVRDTNDFIYALSGKVVKKFSACGKELGALTIPENQLNILRPSGGGVEAVAELIAQYGQPVVAPNGDVYTWKRTSGSYSILKWTWEDDPKASKDSDCMDKAKKAKKVK